MGEKTDAFGRPIGETETEPFGETTTPTVGGTPTATPTPTSTPILNASTYVPPRRNRRTPDFGTIAVILFGLFFFGSIGVGIYFVFTGVRSAVDSANRAVNKAFPATPTPSGTGTDGGSTAAQKPSPSLLGPAALRRALGRVTHSAPKFTGIVNMRIDADRVSGTLRSARGAERIITIARDGTLNSLSTTSFSGKTIPLRSVDPNAPQRMIAAVKRLGVRRSHVSYLVVTANPIDGSPQMLLFTNLTSPAAFYRADLHGRHVVRQG
jgi:hypothetical protein